MDLQSAARALGGEVSGGQILCPGPGHSPKDRSLAVKFEPGAPDGFVCKSHADDDFRTCRDHVKQRLGIVRDRAANGHDFLDFNRAKPQATSAPRPKVVAEYVYRAADGAPYLKVLRTHQKEGGFPQKLWTGSEWAWGKPKGPKIPYRLPELLAAEHDVVFVCEGEKDADNVAALGFVATTASEGAGKWTADLNCYLKDRTVYVLEDNDQAGRKHAQLVARNLHGVAASVRVVALPGLPEGGDVSDWLEAGGTADELARLCESVPEWRPEEEPAKTSSVLIPSADFVAGFSPPDYLIDGLLQRRFCYSNTANTGVGKTAVTLFLAACVALGRPIGGREVERGRVLFFAGENPDDIRMRWLAMAEHMNFDINTIPVSFIPGVFRIEDLEERIRQETEAMGGIVLVVVDTSAAYFPGDSENDNTQMGAHARRMRNLTTLPGGPTVIVNCHPVKNAAPDNLLPRGGGAFVAEVDGNLTCAKNDTLVTLHWQGKFRGPDFAPITFETRAVSAERLKDSKGRPITTVLASMLSEAEQKTKAADARSDEDAMLIALLDAEGPATPTSLAEALRWSIKNGEVNKMRGKRVADRLKNGRLITTERGELVLTEKGTKAAKKAKYNADTAGATYG